MKEKQMFLNLKILIIININFYINDYHIISYIYWYNIRDNIFACVRIYHMLKISAIFCTNKYI